MTEKEVVMTEKQVEVLTRIAVALEHIAGFGANQFVNDAEPAKVKSVKSVKPAEKDNVVALPTKEDVRDWVRKLTKEKGATVGRGVVEEMGAATLSKLDQTLYGKLIKKCKELLDE